MCMYVCVFIKIHIFIDVVTDSTHKVAFNSVLVIYYIMFDRCQYISCVVIYKSIVIVLCK
jgi:hypothetical protein